MAKHPRVHVVYSKTNDEWQNKVEGRTSPLNTRATKAEALEAGRQVAKQLHAELIIHNKDGKISDSDSYGNDPCPPSDTKH